MYGYIEVWIRRLECISLTSAFIAFWEHQQRNKKYNVGPSNK